MLQRVWNLEARLARGESPPSPRGEHPRPNLLQKELTKEGEWRKEGRGNLKQSDIISHGGERVRGKRRPRRQIGDRDPILQNLSVVIRIASRYIWKDPTKRREEMTHLSMEGSGERAMRRTDWGTRYRQHATGEVSNTRIHGRAEGKDGTRHVGACRRHNDYIF